MTEFLSVIAPLIQMVQILRANLCSGYSLLSLKCLARQCMCWDGSKTTSKFGTLPEWAAKL